MSFEEWGKDHWKVQVREFNDEKRYDLHAPGVTYSFNEHDFLRLAHNINAVAEHIYDEEFYYIHDGNVLMRSGGQLIGVIEDCEELNRLYNQNKELEQQVTDLKEELLEFIEQHSSDKPNKKGFKAGRFA